MSKIILTVSLIANLLLISSLIGVNKELNIAVKRTEQLDKALLDCKTRDSIRESEIAKWQRLTNKKQEYLNKETAKRIEIENKLTDLAKFRWDKKQFSGECKKDINVLREHAIKLKEAKYD